MFTVRRADQYDGDVLGEIHAASWEAAYAPFFDPEFAAHATILLAEHDSRPLALSVSAAGESRTTDGGSKASRSAIS
ncbi:hypothetical protein ACGF12_31785 [Kitasatospora sp. NPDC048296]|uniref:hypothetical protein n=1 Tax=Kitasatospora sp. NPDC048296 TaxID=3364048 RepID=UPI003722C6D8